MHRRLLLAGLAAPAVVRRAAAQDWPGVTSTEIRVGSTAPLSGPVSALGVQSRGVDAVFRMVNDQGGIAGRRLSLTVYDDGFQPPRTLEATRRLVEQDRVAFLFNMLGTPTNNAVVRWVNQRRVPHLFLSVNADRWGDHQEHPWTLGFAPSARVEAQIYAKHAEAERPGARIGLLHQNDDYGRDFVAGVRDVLGPAFGERVRVASYEVSDPTIDSQLLALRGGGGAEAQVLICGVTPRFAAQAIRRVFEIAWRPLTFIANSSISVAAVMQPAGVDRGVGVVSSAYLKDPTDAAWAGDAGIAAFRAFMGRYLPDADADDFYYVYAYTVTQVLLTALRACDGEFSRERVMRAATGLRDVPVPTLLPGILVNTGPTDYRPIQQMQLQRWDGRGWARFGSVIEGSAV